MGASAAVRSIFGRTDDPAPDASESRGVHPRHSASNCHQEPAHYLRAELRRGVLAQGARGPPARAWLCAHISERPPISAHLRFSRFARGSHGASPDGESRPIEVAALTPDSVTVWVRSPQDLTARVVGALLDV